MGSSDDGIPVNSVRSRTFAESTCRTTVAQTDDTTALFFDGKIRTVLILWGSVGHNRIPSTTCMRVARNKVLQQKASVRSRRSTTTAIGAPHVARRCMMARDAACSSQIRSTSMRVGTNQRVVSSVQNVQLVSVTSRDVPFAQRRRTVSDKLVRNRIRCAGSERHSLFFSSYAVQNAFDGTSVVSVAGASTPEAAINIRLMAQHTPPVLPSVYVPCVTSNIFFSEPFGGGRWLIGSSVRMFLSVLLRVVVAASSVVVHHPYGVYTAAVSQRPLPRQSVRVETFGSNDSRIVLRGAVSSTGTFTYHRRPDGSIDVTLARSLEDVLHTFRCRIVDVHFTSEDDTAAVTLHLPILGMMRIVLHKTSSANAAHPSKQTHGVATACDDREGARGIPTPVGGEEQE